MRSIRRSFTATHMIRGSVFTMNAATRSKRASTRASSTNGERSSPLHPRRHQSRCFTADCDRSADVVAPVHHSPRRQRHRPGRRGQSFRHLPPSVRPLICFASPLREQVLATGRPGFGSHATYMGEKSSDQPSSSREALHFDCSLYGRCQTYLTKSSIK
jgi:hypothetical protein